MVFAGVGLDNGARLEVREQPDIVGADAVHPQRRERAGRFGRIHRPWDDANALIASGSHERVIDQAPVRPHIARTEARDDAAQLVRRIRRVAIEQYAPSEIGCFPLDALDRIRIEGVQREPVAVLRGDPNHRLFDVKALELDVSGCSLADGVQYVGEPGDTETTAEIEARKVGPERTRDHVPGDDMVMVYDHFTIAGDVNVQFDRVGPVFERDQEPGQGVFHPFPRRTPVRNALETGGTTPGPAGIRGIRRGSRVLRHMGV